MDTPQQEIENYFTTFIKSVERDRDEVLFLKNFRHVEDFASDFLASIGQNLSEEGELPQTVKVCGFC